MDFVHKKQLCFNLHSELAFDHAIRMLTLYMKYENDKLGHTIKSFSLNTLPTQDPNQLQMTIMWTSNEQKEEDCGSALAGSVA